MEFTTFKCLRFGPPCLAKRLSCAKSMSSLSIRSDDKKITNHFVLRSNSRRVRKINHCRDKLFQNQLNVLYRCCFSIFRRLTMNGGEKSVVGFVSIYSCRFRLRGIEFSQKTMNLRFMTHLFSMNDGQSRTRCR